MSDWETAPSDDGWESAPMPSATKSADGWETASDSVLDSVKDVAMAPNRLIAKAGTNIAYAGVGAIGGLASLVDTDTADKIFAYGDRMKDAANKTVEQNLGKSTTTAGDIAEGVGTGVGMTAATVANPVLGLSALSLMGAGGAQEQMQQMNQRNVHPSASLAAGETQYVANLVLGLLPGKGAVGGALTNWLTGQMSDAAAYKVLVDYGHQDVADELFKRKTLDKQGVIDLIVGALGGKMAHPTEGKTAKEVDANLKQQDEAKTEAAKTQGEGVVYVDQEGRASKDLGTQVREDGSVVDEARGQVQDRLNEVPPEKFSYWEPNQQELFDPISGPHYPDAKSTGQLDLELRTPREQVEPKEILRYNQETGQWEMIPDPKPEAKAYDIIPEDPEVRARKEAEEAGNANAPEGRSPGYTHMVVDPETGEVKGYFHTRQRAVTERNNRGMEGKWEVREVPKEHQAPLGANPEFVAEPHEIKSWMETLQDISNQTKDLPDETRGPKVADLIRKSRDRLTKWWNDFTKDPRLDRLDGGVRIQSDGTIHLKDMLDHMFKVADSEHMPEVRKPLAALLRGLAPYLADVKIRVELMHQLVPDENGKIIKKASPSEDVMSNGRPVPGFYNSPRHEIVLGSNGLTFRTVMHEMVHAATARAIHAFTRTEINMKTGDHDYRPTSRTPKPIKNLIQILDHIRSKAQLLSNKEGKNGSYYLEGAKVYGLSDLHEFAAELATNRYLENWMRKQKSIDGLGAEGTNRFKSLWDQWINSVKDMLGIKAQDTLFDQAASNLADLVAFQADPENAKLINDALKGKFDKTRDLKGIELPAPPKDAEGTRTDKLREATGINWVSRDPDVKDPALKATIVKEKDGNSIWALTPGALMRAALEKSTLVQTVYRLADNASKRTAVMVSKVVEPVEKSVSRLLNKGQEAAILHKILMRELANGRDYSVEELKAAGVSDRVIETHREFRAMMEQVLSRMNTELIAKDKEPVTALQAYLSSRWSGPWRMNIRDENGKIVWQIAEHSLVRAKMAEAYIRSKDPNLKFDKIDYIESHEKPDMLEAGYQEMMNLLDPEDPRVKMMQGIYQEYALSHTEDIANQERHFLKKTGVRGFAGDRPWAKNDARDFFIQQIQYAKNAYKWAEYQTAVTKAGELLRDPDIKQAQPNNVEYSKEYLKTHIGFGTKELFRKLDNSVAKYLGVSPDTIQSGIGAGKTYFYLSRLGLSIPFLVTQLIQPIVTTPAWHADLSFEGFKHNPIQTLLFGVAKGGAAAIWHYASQFGSENKFEHLLDNVDKDAVRYMEANKIIDINPLSDIKKNMRPTVAKVAAYPFEFSIRHSEVIARSMAFMSYVDHLKQSGKYDLSDRKQRLEMFAKAEDMTKLSMTDYRPTERAPIFERMGMLGDVLSTLHSFMINNVAQLIYFSDKAAKTGNMTPFAIMVFMQFAMAGASGLWGVDDLEAAWDQIKKYMPADTFMKFKDKSIKGYMLANLGEIGTYGLASKITGTNIHTRMTGSNLIPVWPFEDSPALDQIGGLAPFVGTAVDTGTALYKTAFDQGSNRSQMEALYKGLPAFAQGPLEANHPAFTAPNGVSKATSNLNKGQYKRSDTESVLFGTMNEKTVRNIGLRSLKEQEQKDKEFKNQKMEKIQQEKLKAAGESATENLLDGNTNKAVENLKDYVTLNGDPRVILRNIPQARIQELTTEVQRRVIAAGKGNNYSSTMKLKQYLDAMRSYEATPVPANSGR